ncbi:MAG TPA: hypothetical protein VG963_34560 [Polyangiaceae bacterium]|nr:hypothetical protein [Polyangiaceae bacterium]HVZ37612.1 hypothetical protein [Polyangiaceae bacterium]
MGEQISHETAVFLERFDASRSDPTIDFNQLFVDPFLALDPTSVHALNPTVLAKVFSARREMFAKAGVTKITRRSATESRVDDIHRLVAVEWTADRGDAPALTLTSSFLLRREEGRLRVVVYLNHVDVQALLAAKPSQQ